MKTILSFVFLLLFNSLVFASDADLFTYNKSEIDLEMAELNQIENQLQENNFTLPGQILLNNSFLQQNSLDFSSKQSRFAMRGIEDAAFLVGCCLGPLGLIIVVAQHDFEAAGKAFVGCLIPSGLITIGIITDDPFLIRLAIEIFVEVFSD